MYKFQLVISLLLLTVCGFAINEVGQLPSKSCNPDVLQRIDSLILQGLNAKAYPGCQVYVLKDDSLVYARNAGRLTYEGTQPVTDSTLYDLASLTKATGTLLAVMKLYDNGQLQLTDRASLYLPILRGTNKEAITLYDLLVHESGLPASLNAEQWVPAHDSLNPFFSTVYSDSFALQVTDSLYVRSVMPEVALYRIAGMRLKPKTYLYSCVNFILLQKVVESLTQCRLDCYLDSVFYQPMNLRHLTFLPLNTHPKAQIAPTLLKDAFRKGVIQGFVHDPDAALLGGVSGNAGLFGTAADVAKVCQLLLNGGEYEGRRYLSEATCRLFTTTTSASGRRGLGFDKPVTANPAKSPCCPSAPSSVYGHTGYTGTCWWVDPENRLIYVFLSNRTYPKDGVNTLARMHIRSNIQEVLYQSMI